MGKHDAPAPLNESLEQHYKERIKALEETIADKDRVLENARMALERFDIRLEEKEKYIEELRSALVEQTIKATMGR